MIFHVILKHPVRFGKKDKVAVFVLGDLIAFELAEFINLFRVF
jgi:hypothetical protein